MYALHCIRILPALLALLCLAACGESAAPPPSAAVVRYFTVTEERVTLTSDLPGRVSALVSAEVRPQVDGIILERLFEEGADVARGQVLYQIDPAIYQAAYNTAKAALEEAEANLEALALLEKRYTRLVKTNAISRQDLDNATASHSQARARIARAKAELESAAINLAYTSIKAPVAGRIGASSVTQGALVTANQADALAVIRQTDKVYVDITQSSADTIRLRRAMAQGRLSPNGSATRVLLTLEDGSPYTLTADTHSEGRLERIAGDLLFSEISVGRTTGSVVLRAVFPNPEGLLLPGMYVKATIEEGAVDKAVLVPQSAVLSDGFGGHVVFVLQKKGAPGQAGSPGSTVSTGPAASAGTAVAAGAAAGDDMFTVSRRAVTLERSLGNRWIVGSGLAAGERVLVEGLQKAVHGGTVRGLPQETAKGASASAAQPGGA